MDNKTNTLVFHGCGGAGITILDYVSNTLDKLGDGFAKPKYSYIDTSRANIDNINPKGDFWLIKTKSHSKMEITGSGGERGLNAIDSIANAKEYLDNNGYIERKPDEFHIIIASASGGSGGIIGYGIFKELLDPSRNIPAVMVLVGDSSDALRAKNSLNTLSTFDNLAKNVVKRPISIIYLNNHSYVKENVDLKQAEKMVNDILTNVLSTLSLFLSGQNEAIDNQDMYGIISQSHYTTINILPGLYNLMTHSKNIKAPEGSTPTVARTLTIQGQDFETNISMLHHKYGYVVSENAINLIKKDNFPIHLVAYGNGLVKEVKTLQSISAEYDKIIANMYNEDLFGTASSKVDEKTGLVL